MYLLSVEDPLEQIGNDAVRVSLNTSCENTKYLDFEIINCLVESIKSGECLIPLGESLKALLKKSTRKQLESVISGAVTTFAVCHRTHLEEKSIPVSILRSYILTHNSTVLRSGNEYATQVYGIKYSESKTLMNVSGFLNHVRKDLYTIRLRCSESIVEQILKCDDKETLESLKLAKIQQCLSEKVTSNPGCKSEPILAFYDPETDPGRANIDQAKKLLARKMLINGYTVSTVSLELGLSPRQCRLVYENVKESKFLDHDEHLSRSKTKSTRLASNFIKNKSDVLNASILMKTYSNIGGEAVKNHTLVSHLNVAYAFFCSVRHDVYGLAERTNRRISIQDAWTLAVELRSNLGYFRVCNSCGAHFHCSADQCLVGEDCVFCNSEEVELIK